MHTFANRLVNYFANNSDIEIKQIEWCTYALEKKLYRVLSFVLVLVVGAFFQVPFESAIVFLSTNYLRTRISGWHAENPIVCILLTIAISCGAGFLAKLSVIYSISIYLIILFINVLLFCCYTPINNQRLHLSTEEILKNKTLAKTKFCILVAISALVLPFAQMQLISICLQFGCLIALVSTFFNEGR